LKQFIFKNVCVLHKKVFRFSKDFVHNKNSGGLKINIFAKYKYIGQDCTSKTILNPQLW
jgi:hypothetical protein